LPEGKAYTYGNKLRAYIHSNPLEIKELVNTEKYKDFEFGRGSHLDKNVKYSEVAEIDQIQDIIDVLKRDLYSKACVAITWHVHEELMRKHKSSPCLVLLQAVVQDEKLNLTFFVRSHDMVQGWPENAYGLAAMQKYIADGIGIKPGILTIISGSAQIYRHYYKQVEEMLKKFRKREESFSDPVGNFLVEVKDGMIVAKLIDSKTGKEIERYEGKTAKDVYAKIAFSGHMETEHALYIGSELGKAEAALRNGLKYEQDVELKF
jgi:thymidylate synthase